MTFISNLLKLLIKLRYNINIKWVELLDSNHTSLIFPSHIALIDPIIIFAFLWQKKKINPVITESYYKVPILKRIFKSIWAISITDLTNNKNNKELDTSDIVEKAIKSLENNHNILLYPQWELARQWFQSIVGKKTAY